MYEYYFLFALALIWAGFAAVQDSRTREIANWITFSLIAFVLAYRAFYSIYTNDISFFLYGLGGVLLFTAMGYLFYYLGVFAGGDAKLLFGIGGIIPYISLRDYIFYGLGFMMLLFAIGVLYTLIYSLFYVKKNFVSFKKSFAKEFRLGRIWIYVSAAAFAALLFIDNVLIAYSWTVLFLPVLYFYARAVEKSCMIKMTSPDKLTEGDWLVDDVRVGRKIIKKTVHGLTYEEILLLRRAGKKVLIKSGVPFAPAFLISLIIATVYFLR